MAYEDPRDLPRRRGPTHVCSYCGERIEPDEAVPDFASGGFICPDCHIERRAMRDR